MLSDPTAAGLAALWQRVLASAHSYQPPRGEERGRGRGERREGGGRGEWVRSSCSATEHAVGQRLKSLATPSVNWRASKVREPWQHVAPPTKGGDF